MIDRTEATSTSGPSGAGPATRLPLEGGHDPPDLRLRGRLARAGRRHRSSRPTSISRRPSAASTSRSRSSRRRWTPSSTPRMAGALARLGGLAILNLEGVQTRYDEPAEVLERIAAAADGDVQAVLAEAYQAPIREELIARRHRRDPRRRLAGRGRRHAGRRPAVRAVLRRARRGPLPGPEPGLVGPPPRDRIRPAVARRVHPLHADPGRGRQHDQRRGGLRADGAGRRRGLRRGRARAPPARPARSSASASRR